MAPDPGTAVSVVPSSVVSMNTVAERIHGGMSLVSVTPTLWRALERTGAIAGHVELLHTPEGERYRAKRFATARAAFVVLGEFWSMDEALECLHCL